MLLPTLRRWLAPVVTSLLLVMISLSLTIYPQAALAQSASIKPTQGPANTQVTGSGTNWKVGHQIQVTWADNASVLANTTVQSNGTFTVGFNIPSYAGQGSHNIYFTDSADHYSQVAAFTVSGRLFLTIPAKR